MISVPLLFAAVMFSWRVGLWGAGLPLLGNLLFLFHPLIHRVNLELVSGRMPLWNSHVYCGLPLLADPQAGVLSPTHLPFRFFGFPLGFRLNLAAGVLLAAYFTYCLGRRLGLRRSAAWIAAFLAASNGFVYYHSGLVPHMASLVYTPAVLLFWCAGEGALMGMALALQCLGGHPFFVYITLFACLFVRPRRALATMAAAGLVAAALSAVQLLPALELFAGSVRSGSLAPAGVFNYSVSPDELWRMLARPWWNRLAANFTGDPTITSFYVGLPALAAALAGVRAGRSRSSLIWALCGLWLMMGDHTPLYPLLLKILPGLALFRFPAQWGWLCALGIALLAGFGLQAFSPPLRAAWIGLILADLWIFTGVSPTARVAPDFYSLRPATLSQNAIGTGPRVAHTESFLASQSSLEAVSPEAEEGYWLSQKSALVASHGTVFGLSEAASYNIARPRRADALLKACLDRDAKAVPFLRFLGVSALIDGEARGFRIKKLPPPNPRVTWVARAKSIPFERSVSYLAGEGFRPEEEVVLESAPPPMSPNTFPYGTQDGVAAAPRPMSPNTFPYGTQDGVAAAPPEERREGSAKGKAQVLEETSTRMTLATEAEAPGYLVWADSFHPGWTAYIDGRPAEILRANRAYRALRLPAGSHDVRFHYHPAPFEVGVLAGLAGLAALAGMAARKVLAAEPPNAILISGA